MALTPFHAAAVLLRGCCFLRENMSVKQEPATKLIPGFFGQTVALQEPSVCSVLSPGGGYHSSEESLQYGLLSTNHVWETTGMHQVLQLTFAGFWTTKGFSLSRVSFERVQYHVPVVKFLLL